MIRQNGNRTRRGNWQRRFGALTLAAGIAMPLAACDNDSILEGDDPDVAISGGILGTIAFRKGDRKEARRLLQDALRVHEAVAGPDNPNVAATLNLLAGLEAADGHPDVARICGNLGRVAQQQGDFKLAKALLEKAIVIDRAAQGYDHPDTALDHAYMGDLLLTLKDAAGAERHFREAMNAAEAAYGMCHSVVLACLEKLAAAHTAAGDAEGARWAHDRATAVRRSLAQQGVHVAAIAG
jgi:tetratricopeptide (TPR) repeat protein